MRKVGQSSNRVSEFSLTPYEMLMDDIRQGYNSIQSSNPSNMFFSSSNVRVSCRPTISCQSRNDNLRAQRFKLAHVEPEVRKQAKDAILDFIRFSNGQNYDDNVDVEDA